MNPHSQGKCRLLEWFVACGITLAILGLHWVFFRHAGALWRDETAIVNIASLPSWPEVWRALPHDHCPILFPALVRFWSGTGMGNSDAGLRVLGLGLGLFLLAAFWISNRLMSRGLPLFSLPMAAMTFTVITFGDSLRAYGLATALILLTLGFVWRFLEKPTWSRAWPAMITAVLSVQTLYQNAFLVLAICLAGIALCLVRRQIRPACAVFGIGLTAALSLLPYLHAMLAAQSWWALSKTGEGLIIFVGRLIQITGGYDNKWFVLVLFMSMLLAAVLGIGQFFMGGQKNAPEPQPVCFFAGVALVAGFACYGIFFKLAGLTVQPWYCIPVLGFMAVCCDVILPRMHQVLRTGVLAAAIVSTVLAFPGSLAKARQPRTNGVSVIEKLSANAGPGDLVVVHPWYFGLTFARYYNGNLAWKTLPPLDDYRFHRYDLLKPKMQMTNAIQPVLEQVEATLRAGHRIWIVGDNTIPKSPTTPPADLPPAPYGPGGWFDALYTLAWGEKFGYLLATHATNSVTIIDPVTNPLPPWENLGLTVVSGWADVAPTNAAPAAR
jgi:hypothetical protein